MSPSKHNLSPYKPSLHAITYGSKRGKNTIVGKSFQLLSPTTPPAIPNHPTMNALPMELGAYICEILCEHDQGASIRSMSLVSTSFHEVSKPYLYRRVAVSGLAQISALVQRLQSRGFKQRTIRDLFLSDTDYSKKPLSSTDVAQLSQGISQILNVASPNLESLAACFQSQRGPSLIARIYRTSMPQLQRLLISGLYPFPSSTAYFPRLKSLHLEGNRNPSGLLCVGGLEEKFPALTSLSITGLEAVSFIFEVEEATISSPPQGQVSLLEDRAPTSPNVSFPAKLPSNLQRLTLQAGPRVNVHSEIVLLKNELMMAQLSALHDKVAHMGLGELRIQVLDRQLMVMTPRDVMDEWAGIS